MQPIKNTYEKLLIQRLQTNCFKRRRSPSPIKFISLNKALVKLNNDRLAKEIAYVLSTDFSYRLIMADRYTIAYNCMIIKKWEDIAVLQLKNKIDTFDSLICINLKEYTDKFRIDHPVFMNLILFELNTIVKS